MEGGYGVPKPARRLNHMSTGRMISQVTEVQMYKFFNQSILVIGNVQSVVSRTEPGRRLHETQPIQYGSLQKRGFGRVDPS
jgi:hypothetical protein